MMEQLMPLSLCESPTTEKSHSVKEFLEHENKCNHAADVDLNDVFAKITNRMTCKDDNDNEIDTVEPDIELIIKKAEKLIQDSGNLFNDLNSGASRDISELKAATSLCDNKITRAGKYNDINDQELGAGDGYPPNRLQVATELPNTASKVDEAPKGKLAKRCVRRPHSANAANYDSTLFKIREAAIRDKPPVVVPIRKTLNTRHNELLDEMRDTEERLKSIELQYARVLETNRNIRESNNNLISENGILKSKLRETMDSIYRNKSDYESVMTQNSQFQSNNEQLLRDLQDLNSQKKMLELQLLKDKKLVLDLQRQCKEMEKILLRKHPDSVSALIVASKQYSFDDPEKKVLQKRTEDLQSELKVQEKKFQDIISNLQEQFANLKVKYETHIVELESQAHSLRGIIAELNNRTATPPGKDVALQINLDKCNIALTSKQTQTLSRGGSKWQGANNLLPNKIYSALKEDSHLLATIKGLQHEVMSKNKEILKIKRDTEEQKKNLLKLQRERDVLNKINRVEKSMSKLNGKSMDDISVNCVEMELQQLKHQRMRWEKEHNTLKVSLKTLETECEELKEKRIQDLHTLQAAHEKELMELNIKVIPYEENINCLSSTVLELQTNVKSLEDELNILQLERDYLKVQLSARSAPEVGQVHARSRKAHKHHREIDISNLKHKILELEQKHEARELRLKTLGSTLNKLTSSTNPSVTTLE